MTTEGQPPKKCTVLELASPCPRQELWQKAILDIETLGYQTNLQLLSQLEHLLLTAADSDRVASLLKAWSDPAKPLLLAARGGYGVSNLLPLLPWAQMASHAGPTLMGFSDICALQSALYFCLRQASIHGPMPASSYWELQDFRMAEQLLLGAELEMPLHDLRPDLPDLGGKEMILFGGCLSVLTNLIGTPYLQPFAKPALLFFEDIDENPGRVMRMLNQWQQSGYLKNIQAILVGRFTFTDPARGNQQEPEIVQLFRQRAPCKVFHAPYFGHTKPNQPLSVGGWCRVRENKLIYGLHHGQKNS